MRKWEKYLAILLLSLILFGFLSIISLISFRNLILHQLVRKANKNLLIKINFDKAQVNNLINTYPLIEIHLKDLCITGRYEFEKDTLVYIPDIKIIINTQTAVKKQNVFIIQEISANYPKVNLLVNKEGLANYYLFPSKEELTTSAQPYFIYTQSLRIFNGQAQYIDNESNITIKSDRIFGLFRNLKMSGQSAEFFLSGLFSNLFIQYKKIVIANSLNLSIDVNYKNLFPGCQDNYYFNGRFKLNQLKFYAKGRFENSHLCDSLPYHNYQLSINASTKKFKDLLSVINIFYKNNFTNLYSKGQYNIKLDYFSKRNKDIDSNYLKAQIAIKDGFIKYPSLPNSLDNINLMASVEKNSILKIKINYANFRMEKDFFRMKDFFLTFRKNQIIINGTLNSQINLGQLHKILPIPNYKITGHLKTHLSFQGYISTKNISDLRNINITGTTEITNLNFYNPKNQFYFKSNEILTFISPYQIGFYIKESNFNGIRLNSNIIIENAIPYFIAPSENLLKINSILKIKEIDFSKFRDNSKQKALPFPLPKDKNIEIKSILSAEKIIWKNITFNNTKTYLFFTQDSIFIKSLTSYYKDTKFNLKAKLSPYPDGLFVNFYSQIENIYFPEIGKLIPPIEQYAPILNLTQGKFNFTVGGDLFYNYNTGIKLSSINITGYLTSEYFKLPPTSYSHKLASTLNIPDLDTPIIQNLNLNFRFSHNSLVIPESKFLLSGKEAYLSGYTSISGLINYRLGITLDSSKIYNIIQKNITGQDNVILYLSVLGNINSPKIKLSTNLLQAKKKSRFYAVTPTERAQIDSIQAMKVYKKQIKKENAINSKLLIKETRKRTRQIMRKAKQISQELIKDNSPKSRKQARKVIRNARKMKRQLIKQAYKTKKQSKKSYRQQLNSIKKKLKSYKKRIR